jgi:hypothetical protein
MIQLGWGVVLYLDALSYCWNGGGRLVVRRLFLA